MARVDLTETNAPVLFRAEQKHVTTPVLSGPDLKRTPAWVPKFFSYIYCKLNLYLADPSIKRTQIPI